MLDGEQHPGHHGGNHAVRLLLPPWHQPVEVPHEHPQRHHHGVFALFQRVLYEFSVIADAVLRAAGGLQPFLQTLERRRGRLERRHERRDLLDALVASQVEHDEALIQYPP